MILDSFNINPQDCHDNYRAKPKMKIIEHSAYALLFMAIIGLLSGNWFAGACFGSAFFVGREHAQAEYRVIKNFYEGKRENMPWYGGFEPRGWDLKSILDFVLPIAATAIALVILSFFWG
jgi:hypothetical protein